MTAALLDLFGRLDAKDLEMERGKLEAGSLREQVGGLRGAGSEQGDRWTGSDRSGLRRSRFWRVAASVTISASDREPENRSG